MKCLCVLVMCGEPPVALLIRWESMALGGWERLLLYPLQHFLVVSPFPSLVDYCSKSCGSEHEGWQTSLYPFYLQIDAVLTEHRCREESGLKRLSYSSYFHTGKVHNYCSNSFFASHDPVVSTALTDYGIVTVSPPRTRLPLTHFGPRLCLCLRLNYRLHPVKLSPHFMDNKDGHQHICLPKGHGKGTDAASHVC